MYLAAFVYFLLLYLIRNLTIFSVDHTPCEKLIHFNLEVNMPAL